MEYRGDRREMYPEEGDRVTLVVEFNDDTFEIDVDPGLLYREPEHALELVAMELATDLITRATLRIEEVSDGEG